MPMKVVCFGNAAMVKQCRLNVDSKVTFGPHAVYVSDLKGVNKNDTVVVYTHGGYDTKGDDPKSAYATNIAEVSLGGDEKSAKSPTQFLAYLREHGLPDYVDGLKLVLHICHSAGTIEEGRTRPPDTDGGKKPEHRRRPSATFAYSLCEAMKADYPELRVLGYQGTMGAGFAGMPAEGMEHLAGGRAQPSMSSCRMEYAVQDTEDGELLVVLDGHGENIVWRKQQ